MDAWLLAPIWLLLLLCAAGLMALHPRTWRRVRQQDLQPDDLDYHRRQYRRRMQSSAMLGLIAVAIFVGQVLTPRIESKLFSLAYWGGVLLVAGWFALLAVVDLLATKHHFNRLWQTYLVEQAKLHAEIRRLRATRGNGRAPKKQPEPGSKD